MQKQIKAIETQYKGYRFRSRLEARWAVFFNTLGVKWEYEKEGYVLENDTHYLPDFWLPKLEVWIEIKPEGEDEEAVRKCHLLAKETRFPVILIQGIPGCSDGINSDFTMTAYGGEVWDMFIDKSVSYPTDDLFEHSFTTGSKYFEQLRQFVLIQIRENDHLSEEDLIDLSVPFLDETARRKAIVELDCLYFRRKYGREHSRKVRKCAVYFKFSGRKRDRAWIHTAIDGPDYMFLDEAVQEALTAARSARFEHGESG